MSDLRFSATNGHLQLPANTLGRDFVVGDLHGCRHVLEQVLEFHAFDPARDRVFCCGDLVDRGQDSLHTLELLRKPWFHVVKGNHELMLETWLLGNEYHTHCASDYLSRGNGGLWAKHERDLGNDALYDLVDLAARLPLAISVGTGEDRFNVVHAELLVNGRVMTDAELDRGEYNGDQFEAMVWGRKLLQSRSLMDGTWADVTHTGVAVGNDPLEERLSLTYVGHSIVENPILYRSHVYMDAGAYKNGRLHLLQHGWHKELDLPPPSRSRHLVL
jgi:serine/threonine protein phosphatase 1